MVTSIIHWKHTLELGLYDKPLVCITTNNKVVTFNSAKDNQHWLWLVSKYNMLCWCFLSELLPEEFQ